MLATMPVLRSRSLLLSDGRGSPMVTSQTRNFCLVTCDVGSHPTEDVGPPRSGDRNTSKLNSSVRAYLQFLSPEFFTSVGLRNNLTRAFSIATSLWCTIAHSRSV